MMTKILLRMVVNVMVGSVEWHNLSGTPNPLHAFMIEAICRAAAQTLHFIVLHCIVLHCIALYGIVLYCIVLHCMELYCIVYCKTVETLYCIVGCGAAETLPT